MAIRVDAQDLRFLLQLSLDQIGTAQVELSAAMEFSNNFHTLAKLAANYRALSQIFDDLVRIADITNVIAASLEQTEIPGEEATP